MSDWSPMMTRDQLANIVEEYAGVGTWVREHYGGTNEWHRSLAYDGEIHGLACGYQIAAQTRVAQVDTELSSAPDGEICDACRKFRMLEQEQATGDGGQR